MGGLQRWWWMGSERQFEIVGSTGESRSRALKASPECIRCQSYSPRNSCRVQGVIKCFRSIWCPFRQHEWIKNYVLQWTHSLASASPDDTRIFIILPVFQKDDRFRGSEQLLQVSLGEETGRNHFNGSELRTNVSVLIMTIIPQVHEPLRINTTLLQSLS